MQHPFENDLFNIIHADIFKPELIKHKRVNLIENVRWVSNNPNRRGRYLFEIAEIIKDFPELGIAYDLSHAYINEEPMEEIVKYKDRIRMFHINDTLGKEDLHLMPGQGEIDYKKFWKILAEINFRGILWIEP